ncbi:MAG: MerR family transcriptional regulator [Gammaproteobacteria bacterium]|nr:MAG: MerR family transcriptional regulator [Gammaproteobacteria bacterium]
MSESSKAGGGLIHWQVELQASYSAGELCAICRLAGEELVAMVEEGLLQPSGPPGRWRFGPEDLARALAARRLQEDLGVNLAGAALALDLLEELRRMRARVALLERLLEGAPPP